MYSYAPYIRQNILISDRYIPFFSLETPSGLAFDFLLHNFLSILHVVLSWYLTKSLLSANQNSMFYLIFMPLYLGSSNHLFLVTAVVIGKISLPCYEKSVITHVNYWELTQKIIQLPFCTSNFTQEFEQLTSPGLL